MYVYITTVFTHMHYNMCMRVFYIRTYFVCIILTYSMYVSIIHTCIMYVRTYIFCECRFKVILDALERLCLIQGKWLDSMRANTLRECLEWNSVKVRRCFYMVTCVLGICLNCVAWRSWRRWVRPSPKRMWLIRTVHVLNRNTTVLVCTVYHWCLVPIYLCACTYVCTYIHNTFSTLVSCTHCRCSVT